jgi:uncharacterized protein YukE
VTAVAANSDFFHVNFNGLDMLTQTFNTHRNTLQTAFEGLQQVAGTVSAWSGQAQASWASVQTEYQGVLDDMHLLTGMMGSHTANANEAWQTTDASNARRFG